jgi:argininosuccinate lyase
VRAALDSGRRVSELSAEELATHSAVLAEHQEEMREALGRDSALEGKISAGGTALVRVREQLAVARRVVDEGAAG